MALLKRRNLVALPRRVNSGAEKARLTGGRNPRFVIVVVPLPAGLQPPGAVIPEGRLRPIRDLKSPNICNDPG